MRLRLVRDRRRLLSLLVWALLAAAVVTAAYYTGAGVARSWWDTPVSFELSYIPTLIASTPAIEITHPLRPQIPAEGMLMSQDDTDDWEFQAQAGQSVVLEMWFHPGTGSALDARVTVQMFAPDGQVIAQEQGDPFLAPYVVLPALAQGGRYRVRVFPSAGIPGRYTLLLTLVEKTSDVSAAISPSLQLTVSPFPESVSPAGPPAFQWPTPRRSISGWIFHDPDNPSHAGLDIAAQMHDPIVAVASGTVIFAGWGGGYGNLVIVEHTNGWRSYYAHLAEVVVERGQQVRQGKLLGGAGSTGYSTGPHLHFELRYKGRPVDPHLYLP